MLEDFDGFSHLHGFCDASEKGFSGVVYLITVFSNSEDFISLVAEKSKVSPLKRVGLHRLELCGALLLVGLISHIPIVYKIKINKNFWPAEESREDTSWSSISR